MILDESIPKMEEPMKVPIKVTIITAVLTLATWMFFYIVTPAVPLGAIATTVVVGFWLVIVLIFRWLYLKMRKKKG